MARAIGNGGRRRPLKVDDQPAPATIPPPLLNPKQPKDIISDVTDTNFYSPQQPVVPYGPAVMQRPRWWDYQVGYNISYNPRQYEAISFGMLRALASSLGILRSPHRDAQRPADAHSLGIPAH